MVGKAVTSPLLQIISLLNKKMDVVGPIKTALDHL
jgi:hypothetical protein